MLKKLRGKSLLFITVILICMVGVGVFLSVYFEAYRTPYMQEEVINLSAEWEYCVGDRYSSRNELKNLGSGPKLEAGERLILFKKLEVPIPEAAILIRANHQSVSAYLDEELLLLERDYREGENPGMSLHFLLLPKDYLGRTLRLEITSPYYQYSGLTGQVFMGTIPSLEAFTISRSMKSVIMMAMCLLIGLMTMGLTLLQALKGTVRMGNLYIGVFAVVLALYYVCVDYIVFQFFTPLGMSLLSLGFYFLLPVPLMLFFYCSFQHYKKWMLPPILLHGGFVVTAFALQFMDLVQLPQLLDLNNIMWGVLLYTVVLTFLEARKKTRLMVIAAPFMAFTYYSILYNFWTFYGRSNTVPYSYRDTYFLLILSVLIYNIQQFFSQYYQQQRESDLLHLQNRLAKESWEEVKSHLLQVGSLKHEIVRHFAALQTFLKDGRHEQAQNYLDQCVGQAAAVAEVAHHDHFLVNAVVRKLAQKAAELNVKLELNLKPCRIGVSDPDLYSLLNNILENALEACEAMPEDSKRMIRLTLARKEPYLYITCVNSKGGNIICGDEELKTTKPDPSEHGFGLWTVKRIVTRYDGIMDVEYDETSFTIALALKDRQQGASDGGEIRKDVKTQ